MANKVLGASAGGLSAPRTPRGYLDQVEMGAGV